MKTNSYYEGFIYLMVNHNFNGWVKAGKTSNPKERVRRNQTSDPHRAYELLWCIPVENTSSGESDLMTLLETHAIERRAEWFKFPDIKDALDIVEGVYTYE